MSEPASGPRRSARNAAKRVAEKVEEIVKAPAPKKTKAAPKSKASSTKSKPDAAESGAAPEPKDAAATEGTTAEEPTKASSADAATAAPEALKEGDELPSDLPAVTKHTGESVTIQDLVKESKNGIIIFAYPKASTPGCTTQACLFRDSTSAFKDAGYAIFGISGDSPKSNTNFHTKQNLADIVLLCDPTFALHERLGIKKTPKGTIRSVTVIKHQDGKAIIAKKSPANPAGSLDIAKKAAGVA